MRQSLRPCLLAAVLVLAACSPTPDAATVGQQAPPSNPVQAAVREVTAELARLHAQGNDKTAREITRAEYPAYRELMRASGLDAVLGGEAQADAALRELFAGYERKVRSFQDELPKMMPMADTGIEAGYSGFAASMITGLLQQDAAITVWDQGQKEGQASGRHSQSGDGSSIDMQWSETRSSVTSSFEGKLPGGLEGKITTKVELDTCPGADGSINVGFTSKSEMRSSTNAGVGGSVNVSAKLVKFLDDDAHLIDDRLDSEVRVEQAAFDMSGGSYVDLTQTLSTTRGETGTKVNRRSQAASDSSVQSAQDLARLGMLAAFMALEAAKKPWESGHCVKLDVTSDPGKRKGVRPNTAFDLDAKPRAKSDGAPTRGTVTATLRGGSALQPGSGKVPADAKYQYTGPDRKEQSASVQFEARSKRGVGKATMEFDTKKGGYHIVGGQNDFKANTIVCSIEGPFDIPSSAGIVMHMLPSGAQGGSWKQSGSAAGVSWSGGGNYTLALDADGNGTLSASGTSTIKTPMGAFSDSVEPTFRLSPASGAECQ